MALLSVILAFLGFCATFVVSSPITIKLDNGQTYKCVDFYKQPAFRNLSLNLQVAPNLAKVQQQNTVSGFGLGSHGCPIGTVPILYQSKQFATYYSEIPEPRPRPRPQVKEHCFSEFDTHTRNKDDASDSAKVRTVYDANKKFYGANGGISIYKPSVESNQWSSSRLKLLNGAESIEAGWMVNPAEFKDNEAHLYASFSANGKQCINLDCPGFVQVSTAIPLGIVPHAYSTVDRQITWNLSIDKHQDDGNWWLSIKEEKHQIGYWPKNLFSTLNGVADQVEFGGEINDPSARYPPPSMGNGLLAEYDTQLSSYFYHATVVDESFKNINPPDTEKVADCTPLYTVLDGGFRGNLGRLIFYGGPGPLSDRV